MDERERRHAIDLTLSQLDKQFGKGAVLRLGSGAIVPVAVIPSGSISLDAALGLGGFPRGETRHFFEPATRVSLNKSHVSCEMPQVRLFARII